MEQTGIDPDELNRGGKCVECDEKTQQDVDKCPNCGGELDWDWNSLLTNYSKHDIGEAHLTGRIKQRGFQVENWGIDQRHDDSGLIFDNKMDLRL
jgi:predicted ATP-dependent serine protease